MDYELRAIDAPGGQAAISHGEKWYLVSMDTGWSPVELADTRDILRWASSVSAVSTHRRYASLVEAVADVRQMCLSAMEMPSILFDEVSHLRPANVISHVESMRQRAEPTDISVDELDRKIIALLQLDGRASNAKIARDVGVSAGTVRRRLRRLAQAGVVNAIAVPNLEKLGYATTALIRLQTGPGKSVAVAEAIARLEETHYVAITTGAFDVFVWAGLESEEALGRFLRTKIGSIEGVQHTETFITLSVTKPAYVGVH